MYEGVVQDLIDELGRLPGVGPRGAQRIAFYLLNADPEQVTRLSEVLSQVTTDVRFCRICFNVAAEELCRVCRDERRDASVICVVEEPKDVIAIEKTREFNGHYHVLGGSLSPIDGIGPNELRVRELLTRCRDCQVSEVIIATDPNLDGEATTTYLVGQLTPLGVSISVLASGLPVGGDLEYADEVTLGRAFNGRRKLET